MIKREIDQVYYGERERGEVGGGREGERERERGRERQKEEDRVNQKARGGGEEMRTEEDKGE